MTSLEFESLIKASVEGQEYLKLIEKAKDRELFRESGYELHHIHPRGLGGSLEKSNVVKLTVFEHCLAHLLLAKAYESPVTLKPLTKMHGRQFKDLSELEQVTLNDVWEWSKLRERALHCSHTEEHSRHISEAKKGKPSWRKGVKTPEEVKQKISNALRGRVNWAAKGKPRSEEVKKKISESNKGKHNIQFWKGKHRSEEDKKKISETLKGRVVVVNIDNHHKILPVEEVQSYLDQGWQRGRKFKTNIQCQEV